MSFETLNLIGPIMKAVTKQGYTTPTPIQTQAIPVVLQGRDLLGIAQTGSGKTAAFAIPIIQQLYKKRENGEKSQGIKTLIITPTRELAIQIGESFTDYGQFSGLRHAVIFGGVSQHSQVQALKKGVDILIATPGRLLDLMNSGFVRVNAISIFVLDEADRMLDIGFIHDIRKIVKAIPVKRQTLFFSATMPESIVQLSKSILTEPVKVEVTPESTTVETIEQCVYFIDAKSKKDLLIHLLKDQTIKTALVFTRTKHGADKVVKMLRNENIAAEAIHSNKSQNSRQRALTNFKQRLTRVLVATDIVARGIDVEDLTHVVNFEIPNIPETYVHRIGRTGRAGASGMAISMCSADERPYLKDIQKLTGIQIPVVENHPYPNTGAQVSKSVGNTNSVHKSHRPAERNVRNPHPEGKKTNPVSAHAGKKKPWHSNRNKSVGHKNERNDQRQPPNR